MRHTAWTLLFVLLLQLVAGTAWALHPSTSGQAPAHCHEELAHDGSASDAHHATADKAGHGSGQADGHHCCAVGLGPGMPSRLMSLPHTTPVSGHRPWVTLSLPPDLRPPIRMS